MNSTHPLLDYQNITLTPEQHQRVNAPLQLTALGADEEEFLKMLMQKIDRGEIKLMEPNSLLNLSIYEKLKEEDEYRVDLVKHHVLILLRHIRDLFERDIHVSAQMQNLIAELKRIKEKCEAEFGDVFKI
jgi:hypothetical protein